MAKVVGALVSLLGLAMLAGGAYLAWTTVDVLTSGERREVTILGVTSQRSSSGSGRRRHSGTSQTTHVEVDGVACNIGGDWGSEGDTLVVRYAAGHPAGCIADSWSELVMPLGVGAIGIVPTFIGVLLIRGRRRGGARPAA